MGIWWREDMLLMDLNLTNDIALLDEIKDELQGLTNRLEKTAKRVGLRISATKSKVMHIGDDQDKTPFSISKHNIEEVDSFICLGSQIASNDDMDADGNYRKGKVAAVFKKIH